MKIEDRIIYEDKDIIVCHKPAGVATQTGRIGQQDMVSLLINYLAQKEETGKKEPFVGVIHRLDQPVEGILVFAKSSNAAKELNLQLTSNFMEKRYYAAFYGEKPYETAVIADYLLQDRKTNTSAIVTKDTKDAKKALLEYQLLHYKEKEQIGLLDIHLITGRHHQIRVQMAGAGMGLLGDQKYASQACKEVASELKLRQVSLCAYQLSFAHPKTQEKLVFKIEPEGNWYQMFGKIR